MKKIISIVILCAMLLSVLVSCGSPAETALNLENYPTAKENTENVAAAAPKTAADISANASVCPCATMIAHPEFYFRSERS